MKTLVVYASKYGATKEAAQWLAKKLEGEVTVLPADMTVAPAAYDAVVLGGPVYMTKLHPSLRRYYKKWEAQLLKKKLGLFLCCAAPPQTKGYLEKFFPPALVEHAQAKELFGGILDEEKMGRFDRMIMKMVTKQEGFQPPVLSETRINKFAQDMRE